MEDVKFEKAEHTPSLLRYEFTYKDKFYQYAGNVVLSEFAKFDILIDSIIPICNGEFWGSSVKEMCNHLEEVEQIVITTIIEKITERGN